MGSRVDDKFAALRAQGFTGTVTDMTLQWLQANGATSSSQSDAWLEMMAALGFEGQHNDAWYALLGSLGYEGAISDRTADFWLAGGTLAPLPDATLLYDETGQQPGVSWLQTGLAVGVNWDLSDVFDVGDPIADTINGLPALRTLSSRLRTTSNLLAPGNYDYFFAIETTADVVTGQGLADNRSNAVDGGYVYILNNEVSLGTHLAINPNTLSVPIVPGVAVIWARLAGADSLLRIVQAGGESTVDGVFDVSTWNWVRTFGGLNAPVGQAHFPGKIGEIRAYENLTRLVGAQVLAQLWGKFNP